MSHFAIQHVTILRNHEIKSGYWPLIAKKICYDFDNDGIMLKFVDK